jgi:hypothetical protein
LIGHELSELRLWKAGPSFVHRLLSLVRNPHQLRIAAYDHAGRKRYTRTVKSVRRLRHQQKQQQSGHSAHGFFSVLARKI